MSYISIGEILKPQGIKGELKVGDYVEISYLPKSTIVLEVTIIYQEELTIN